MSLTKVPPQRPGREPPGENGSGKWYGSSSSGSDDAKAMKRAMQGYLQVINGFYGVWSFTPLQQKLAMQAWKIRMSPSGYAALLRREDPRYVRTKEFKEKRAEATDLYQQFRPGRPVPQKFAEQYARLGMSKARFIDKVKTQSWFKRQFPDWQRALKSGMISESGQGAVAYRSLVDMLDNSFRAAGHPTTPLLHRMLFSSGMDEETIARNLPAIFGGQEALKWATGSSMDSQQMLKAALTKRFGQGALGKIGSTANATANYMRTKSRAFDIGVDEASDNLTLSRI